MTKTQKTLENKTGISIQASPDKVWEVLVDLEHYEDWNPLFVKARGTLAEGEILQIKTRLPVRMFCGAPMTRNWTSRVTKVLPNNSLEWFTPALMNGFLDGTHFFQLTASSDGQTTEFVQGERYEGWGTGFFAGFGTLEDARLGFAVMNRALKLEVLRRLSEGELVATDDGTTTVVALSTHGDMKEKGGEDVHNTNTTATTTTISSAAVDEKGGANKGSKGAAVTRSAAAEEEEEEEEDDDDDAEETIEVVGVRGRTTAAAKSGDDEEDEDDEEEDEDTDDDDDAENNTSQREAAVQGLDISDRHAVDAARATAATTSSPLTTSTESSSPPAQGHGKRRSLVERISMFSVQSASSPASVHNNSGLRSSTAEEDEDEIDPSRTSTSRPRLHTQEAGEEEGEQQHDRLFDRPPPQLQLQFQPRSSLSHDGGGAGGAEEAKLSKADSKPFQLGLDLSLGSGLDFTF
ncbi:hypothetical protein DFQ27_006040 [Actinomortierella ambigua]|uniref:SRPBCC domain-containing protein n=1 Tax=Actinomortierella ambigua TaxID=1343610 RepID=A0A9P6UB29_9FUNG|nr:hypothetical protein DFQ27_006040 [Actinomortierella ambigua]